MKAAIYNPYLDTLGGGERYTMSFAKALAEIGYTIDFEWKEKQILTKLQERFDLKVDKINAVKSINRGDGYDVCFWVSDGSVPTLRSRNNILHFQFPFKSEEERTLLNKMKLFRVKNVICNSYFTKGFIDETYGVNSKVIYPPVAVDKFRPKRKLNRILYVGRFSNLTQSKGQNILIDTFKKLFDSGERRYKLVLAGGAEVGAGSYVNKLREMAKGYPISIKTSLAFKDLRDLYETSKFFWSASGFGESESDAPTKVEHFGISLVEAMAAGCVALAYDAGGHREIVANGENGYLWGDTKGLIKLTKMLANDTKLTNAISKQAVSASKVYEYDRFAKEVEDLL